MTALALSLAIAGTFFLTGDWLHRLLARGAARDLVTHFVLSAWAGLIACLLTATTLYHATGAIAVRDMAWPLIGLFSVASACAVRLAPSDTRTALRPPWALVGVATAGLLLLSAPLFGLAGSGFYFSNNGEYINYAVLADLVQHHPSGRVATTVDVVSRESVVGILCALVSTLFGKSALVVVQPFSNALAWLSFLSFGIVLRRLTGDWPLRSWQGLSATLIYATAILSAANQQLWTLSFLSQYVNAAVFFGFLAFCAESGDGPPHPVRSSLALGLALGAMACAYPEMFVLSAGLVSVFHLASGQRCREDLGSRLRVLGGAVVIGAIVGNRLGVTLVSLFAGGGDAMRVRGGWDIFGPTEMRSLAGNLLGVSNVFAHPGRAGWLVTAGVVGTLILVVRDALVSLAPTSRPLLRGVSALALCYVAAAASLLALVVLQRRQTNYVAVKFMAAFGWIAFLAAASWATRLRGRWLGVAVALCWAALLVPVMRVEAAFARNLQTTARHARFSERDMEVVRAGVGDASNLFITGAPWNMKAIGVFLARGTDLLTLWTPRPGDTAARFVPVPRLSEFSKQAQLLSLGEPEHATLGYRLALTRDTLTLWDNDVAHGRGVHVITASSVYGGLDTYKAANAVDLDEKTEWVAQGSGPATVTLSWKAPGTLRSLTLVSRKTSLFESWHRVTVVLYLMDRRVAMHEVAFEDAATVPLHEIPLPPVESDRIELTFSEPVTQTPGGARVSPAAVNPGYVEIVPAWK